MKKTYSEVIEILTENCPDINDFINEDFEYKVVEDLVGDWKEIHVSGGSDKGSDWVRVYHFKDQYVYIQISAYYSSYNGIEVSNPHWTGGDVREVRPKEVIKVIYE